MNTNKPQQSTDGVGRAHALPQAVEVPAPPQHPADAAPVLTPELLDRETAADLAGAIVGQILAAVPLAALPLATLPWAALPPVWQVWLVGAGLSVLAGVGVLLLFLPAGRRRTAAMFRVGDEVVAVEWYHPLSRLGSIPKPWIVTAIKRSIGIDGESEVVVIRINHNFPWLPEEMFRAVQNQRPQAIAKNTETQVPLR